MVTPVAMEPTLKYHPGMFDVLTSARYPGQGQCLVGSLTGAVSSQRVTEEREARLGTVGNRATEGMARSRVNCETHRSSRCESRPK